MSPEHKDEIQRADGIAFGLSLKCEPLILECGRSLKVTISISSEGPEPPRPVIIEVKDHLETIFYKRIAALRLAKHRSDVVRIKIDSAFPPGQYAVHAYYLGCETAGVETFELVKPGFAKNVKRLTAGLDLQQDAVRLKEQGNLRGVEQRLSESAETLSELGCHEIASSALRDLASIQISLSNAEKAANSLRAGLLEVLRASYSSQQSQQVLGNPSAVGLVPLSLLNVRRWQVADFFDLLAQLKTSAHATLTDTEDRSLARKVVQSLIDLGETSRFFLRILEANIADRNFASLCYLGLSRFDHRRAIKFVPKILAVADPNEDFFPNPSLMRSVIAGSNSIDLYRSLPTLVQQVDGIKRKAFIELLLSIVPAKWFFTHKEWTVYVGSESTSPTFVIPNTDSKLRAILPAASNATFAEAVMKVMSATG